MIIPDNTSEIGERHKRGGMARTTKKEGSASASNARWKTLFDPTGKPGTASCMSHHPAMQPGHLEIFRDPLAFRPRLAAGVAQFSGAETGIDNRDPLAECQRVCRVPITTKKPSRVGKNTGDKKMSRKPLTAADASRTPNMNPILVDTCRRAFMTRSFTAYSRMKNTRRDTNLQRSMYLKNSPTWISGKLNSRSDTAHANSPSTARKQISSAKELTWATSLRPDNDQLKAAHECGAKTAHFLLLQPALHDQSANLPRK